MEGFGGSGWRAPGVLGVFMDSRFGWLSKLGSLLGTLNNRCRTKDPKRDHNFDNHPFMGLGCMASVVLGFGALSESDYTT